MARAMRKAPTPSESLLWAALRNRQLLGLKFRRQHVIAGYIADFYCPSLSLVIEVDGPVHDEESDRMRDEVFVSAGIVVLRFSADEVETNLSSVVAAIARACETLRESRAQPSSPSPFSRFGRRGARQS